MTTYPLPQLLRRWRRRYGLTQAGAAEILGVSKRAVENWEQGRAIPRSLALEALTSKLTKPPTP